MTGGISSHAQINSAHVVVDSDSGAGPDSPWPTE